VNKHTRRNLDEAYYREVKLQQLKQLADTQGLEQVTEENLHRYLPEYPGRHKVYRINIDGGAYFGYSGCTLNKRLAFHEIDSRTKNTTLYRTWREYKQHNPDFKAHIQEVMTFRLPMDALLYEVKMIHQAKQRGLRVLNDSAGGEGPTFHVRNRAKPKDILKHFDSVATFNRIMGIVEPIVPALPLIGDTPGKLVHTTRIEDAMLRSVGFDRLQTLQYYRHTKSKVRRRLRKAWTNKDFKVLLNFFTKAKQNKTISIR